LTRALQGLVPKIRWLIEFLLSWCIGLAEFHTGCSRSRGKKLENNGYPSTLSVEMWMRTKSSWHVADPSIASEILIF
jgi:hypothetical protein